LLPASQVIGARLVAAVAAGLNNVSGRDPAGHRPDRHGQLRGRREHVEIVALAAKEIDWGREPRAGDARFVGLAE
jgi:hypothetical protein